MGSGAKTYVGEALVRQELELVFLLDRTMLADHVLICRDTLAVLAFEDVGFSGAEAWHTIRYFHISDVNDNIPLICAILYSVLRCASWPTPIRPNEPCMASSKPG